MNSCLKRNTNLLIIGDDSVVALKSLPKCFVTGRFGTTLKENFLPGEKTPNLQSRHLFGRTESFKMLSPFKNGTKIYHVISLRCENTEPSLAFALQ